MPRPDGFFDAELMARVSRHELTARRMVNGFLAGKNRSNRHGYSVEFTEHREYVPGDDLRHLDWKVLGRMDRYYIKRYEEETNITAVLLVDVSGSMTYGSGDRTKFELAAYTASATGVSFSVANATPLAVVSLTTPCGRFCRRAHGGSRWRTSRRSSSTPSRKGRPTSPTSYRRSRTMCRGVVCSS